ncbi:MAG TPA: VanW family protein, partial [Acidimicrobiales bacterium]
QVGRVVSDVAKEFEGASIRVSAPGGGFTTDARTLGVSVAEASTVQAAFDTGRDGSVLRRIASWIGSWLGGRAVELEVLVDEAAAHRTVREKDPGPRTEPKEPQLVWEKTDYKVVDGAPGKGLDAADVIDALPDAAAKGEPFVVRVDRGEVEPRFSDDDAEHLVDRAKELVDEPVQVTAGSTRARVPVTTVRSWVRSQADDDGLRLTLDDDAVLEDVGKLLAAAGTPATETTFAVEGGAVKVTPGKAGTKCCAPTAADVLEEAILIEGDPGASVDLPLTAREPAITEAEAGALRITEPVGAFTTKHKAGEPRVQNIHRIADLIRGEVIEPGKTLSVNKVVGRRTKERGFVAAPVIEDGKFSEDVGGGISQFATTLFNAAFFAGLDFAEYQSHSIYISRYPYGREATLSYPKPDLIIENTTPYGVLVWPTYTKDSITVTLYSTKYVTATQSGQTQSPRGACTRVVTERTRAYVDGRTDKDSVAATYRPAEGVNC